jgi:hypothetical protein
MSGRIVKRKEVQSSSMPINEIGKIKIGEKVKGTSKMGKEYERPSSLDYFRCDSKFAEIFKAQYGDKPTKLLIVFISDDVNLSCQERFEAWDNGKRQGWGDGENFTVWNPTAGDDGKGAYVEVNKDSTLLAGKQWAEMVTLRFVLPELSGILGHWTFTTKGKKTSIPGLVQAFDFIQGRMGTVVGVPFELIVEKAKGYNPGEARNYSRVKLIPCISEQYMLKVREFLVAGKSMSEIAPLMVSEAKLLSDTDIKQLAASIAAEEVAHEEVPVKSDVPPTTKMQPNPDLFNEGK